MSRAYAKFLAATAVCAPPPNLESWTGDSGSGWIRVTKVRNLDSLAAVHQLLKSAMGAEFLFTEPLMGAEMRCRITAGNNRRTAWLRGSRAERLRGIWAKRHPG